MYMITNADMTIYNRVPDKGKKCFVYKAHYIPAVSFYTDQKVITGGAEVKSADVYKIRIPEESLEGYLPPDEFARAPDTGWSVENEDLFVTGKHGEIAGIADLAELHRPYGKVSSWSDNRRGGLPHIRIGGNANGRV